MTDIWQKISKLAEDIENKFKTSGDEVLDGLTDQYNWHNKIYSGIRYRRAHIEIVDHRQSYGIYILHSTIFPHFNDPSPIWGFDAICGKTKITGAFHDFSSGGSPDHYMMKWFESKTKDLSWSKPRELPEWARQIFSPSMIAAGNLNTDQEVDLLCKTALDTLDYYLKNVGNSQESGEDYHMAQNRYCHYQKQNPQVVKSMVSMGIDKNIIEKFIEEVLFPEYS